MAKRQSRRSISLSRELYDGLRAMSEREHIPLSQLTRQAIEALLGGRLPLRPARSLAQLVGHAVEALLAGAVSLSPARSPYDLQRETRRANAARQAEQRAAHLRSLAVFGTCANCGGNRHPLMPTKLVERGPTFLICTACNGLEEQSA